MSFILLFCVLASFLTCSTLKTLEYSYNGNSQYKDYYDTERFIPEKVVNLYSCDLARLSLNTSSPKRPGFRPDLRIPVDQQAVDDDYKNSGYTRGHLITAKYFSFNHDAYFNTFYLTNIAPQPEKSNQLWNLKDEIVVLDWMAKSPHCINDMVIETATDGNLGHIGVDHQVVIPSKYLNAVCEAKTGKSICFWIDNIASPQAVYYTEVIHCEESFKFFDNEVLEKYPNCSQFKDELDEEFWGVQNYRNRINSIFGLDYKKSTSSIE